MSEPKLLVERSINEISLVISRGGWNLLCTQAFTGKVTGVMTSSFIQAVQNEPGSTYGRLLNAMHYIIPSLVLYDETVKLQVFIFLINYFLFNS